MGHGLIFIRNPFLPGYQRFWVKQCVQEFPKKPNKTNLDQSIQSEAVDSIWGNEEFIKKLRWVTLGYQYDWTNKLYYADDHVQFPADLAVLTKYFASKLGFINFEPEAGIVNFYHMDSTLGGHTDHSEYDMEAPLFSISFGQTAVFLLGGPTKSTKPVAMFVNSGDVVIMSGPARLAYHAIPRIMPASQAVIKESFTLHDHSEHAQSDPNPPKKIFKPDTEPCFTDTEPAVLKPTSAVESEVKEKELGKFQRSSLSNKQRTQMKNATEEIAQQNEYLTTVGMSRSNVECLVDSASCKSNENLTFDIQEELVKLSTELSWQPYADYLKSSRINMNVRQVLPKGKTFTSM